jgi:hypothetical protein
LHYIENLKEINTKIKEIENLCKEKDFYKAGNSIGNLVHFIILWDFEAMMINHN